MTAEQDKQDQRQQDRPGIPSPQTQLLDEQQRAGSVDGVAEREIRAVKRRRARRNGWWLTLFGILVLAGTLGYLGLQPQPPAPMPPPPQQEMVRRAMPERPQPRPPAAAQGGQSAGQSAPPASAAGSEPEVKPAQEKTAVGAAAAAAEATAENVRDARPVTQKEPPPPPQPLFQVLVGPFITTAGLEQARELLRADGLQPKLVPGTGPVVMIRLREGRYQGDQGQQRLAELKDRVTSAFLLPEEDWQVLYLGSFRDPERARQLQRELARDNIEVSQVRSRLTMEGTLLVLQADRQTAEQLAERLAQQGLSARVRKDQ